jgi:hypothetical protein
LAGSRAAARSIQWRSICGPGACGIRASYFES